MKKKDTPDILLLVAGLCYIAAMLYGRFADDYGLRILALLLIVAVWGIVKLVTRRIAQSSHSESTPQHNE